MYWALLAFGIGYRDLIITDNDSGTLITDFSADLALLTKTKANEIASEDNFIFA